MYANKCCNYRKLKFKDSADNGIYKVCIKTTVILVSVEAGIFLTLQNLYIDT